MIIDRIRRLFGGSEGGESSCEKSLRLLHEYLDGELDDLTASEVAEHFRVCATRTSRSRSASRSACGVPGRPSAVRTR